MYKLNGLSLFSNIGVAEAYLNKSCIDIKVANEIIEKRAKVYNSIYPLVDMIVGDITDENIYKEILYKSKKSEVNFVMATPPCQGMSTVGPKKKNDERNYLIYYALKMISDLNPEYALIENVPQILKTKILVEDEEVFIPDYIVSKIGSRYEIVSKIIKTEDYGVPQSRARCIFLLTRKDKKFKWDFTNKKCKPVTLYEAIGNLPSVDPYIEGIGEKQLLEIFPDFYQKKERALSVSKWHFPPTHKFRHIEVMMHTKEGKSALENEIYYPKNKDGIKVRGFANTYKRQNWNKPGCTVTTYNGAICSQNNVHPGKPYTSKHGEILQSDPRVFTIYELLIIMSLPFDWNLPEWANESLIRHTIGEGIPPLVIKKIVKNLEDNYE